MFTLFSQDSAVYIIISGKWLWKCQSEFYEQELIFVSSFDIQ